MAHRREVGLVDGDLAAALARLLLGQPTVATGGWANTTLGMLS
jgi:hypothetical protein